MNIPRIPAQQSGALTCAESLQRAPSPVLFPENVPGAGKHNTEHDGMFTNKQKNFRTDLSPDDVKLVNAFYILLSAEKTAHLSIHSSPHDHCCSRSPVLLHRDILNMHDFTLLTVEVTPTNSLSEFKLGRLTPDQLAEYIKNVQNTAYTLGIDEARQFSRGKMLQIFKR